MNGIILIKPQAQAIELKKKIQKPDKFYENKLTVMATGVREADFTCNLMNSKPLKIIS